MWLLLGLVFLGVEPSELTVDEKLKPEFKIEIRIVEFKPIKGVTKLDPFSLCHLHIKPALVVTPAEVASVQKRWLRGPTIENVKNGSTKHHPRLVVDIQLTKAAKLRLKKSIEQSRSTTTKNRLVTTVLNDKHLGGWTKYNTDDPSSLVYWSKFGPRISCTSDKENADRLIKYLEQPKKDR